MRISRGHALALIGAGLTLSACGGNAGNAVVVGSKNFTEDILLAEIFSQALERAGIRVGRKFNLGGTAIAMGAMQRGEIDLYPEYTGTGLVDVLKAPPMRDPAAAFAFLAREFKSRYDLVWLQPAPLDNSETLCVTQATSRRYGLYTMSQCSKLAPQLRLGTIAEFLVRPDGLKGIQKFYGGFRFKQVKVFDISLRYDALMRGDADVTLAFTTDPEILSDHLVLLADDRHFWPVYNAAPLVRAQTLQAHPQIKDILSRIMPRLTTKQAQRMNYAAEITHTSIPAIAAAFLKDAGA